MPASLAFFGALILVLWGFISERKRGSYWSAGLLCPLLWYLIVCTRPIGAWLNIFGIGQPGAAGDAAEGSLLDRVFYLTLTVIGIGILSRRHVAWATVRRLNLWIVVLLAYALLSVAWSQYPYVSFKRAIKVVGTFVMALIVATEAEPLEGIVSIVRRCAFIHFPMSLLAAKWFRDIGVSWDWEGVSESWKGIAASKNVLGQVAMVGTIVFILDLIRYRRIRGGVRVNLLFAMMGLYLLKGSPHTISVTSVTVFGFGLLVLLALRACHECKARAKWLAGACAAGILGLGALVVIHSVVMFSADSLLGRVITTFGRDITLTERTLIWRDLYTIAADSPMTGVGYGGFWIGREANVPWNANMSWVLSEGHNGYVDTYLQLGWIGVGLVICGIIASVRGIFHRMASDYGLASLQMTLLLIVVLVNITETTFLRGDHNLWFMFMIATTRMPPRVIEAAQPLVKTLPLEDALRVATETTEASARSCAV